MVSSGNFALVLPWLPPLHPICAVLILCKPEEIRTMSIDSTPNRRLTARRLCERYDVVVRTIDRWLGQGILPPPLIINGRRYWDEEEIERCERAGMGRKLTGEVTHDSKASS